ncbi:cytochrome P450 6j1-like [Schistocerca cancellata]|uniref:cytochrome P450 6j1-like n=1 Tax=Schistocerca cancellata TaxID=274614 RepID=UPI0021193CC8|nr:cytochrome P450 6j1-like [Schistocerca cancellata]
MATSMSSNGYVFKTPFHIVDRPVFQHHPKMGVLTDALWPDLCFLLFAFWTMAYVYASRHFNFWIKQDVPYIKPLPFLGNFSDIVLSRLSVAQLLKKVYEEHRHQQYVGMFAFDQPFLLVRDRRLVKHILSSKVSGAWEWSSVDCDRCPLGPRNIFGASDERWRVTRSRLIPTFTVDEMKQMYHLLNEIAIDFVSSFETSVLAGKPVKVQETLTEHKAHKLSKCIFGAHGNTQNVPQSILNSHLFDNRRPSVIQGIKHAATFVMPFIMKPFESNDGDTGFESELGKTIADNFSNREKHGLTQDVFLELLIQIKNRRHVSNVNEPTRRRKQTESYSRNSKPEEHQLVGLDCLSLLEDFSISFHIINFTLYHLALNQELQSSVRTEVQKYNTSPTYETVVSMKQLDMIVKETLRMYPVFGFLGCKTTADCKLPGTDVTIPADTWVAVSVWGQHMDTAFHPNSTTYNPERFSEKDKLHIEEYTYMPFGVRKNNDTGIMLGLMHSKIALVHVLSKYSIDICEETPEILNLNSTYFLRNAANGIPLKLRKIC